MKRHKELKKAPSTNGEPEVFVVPPHILEELIQLSSISCPTGDLLEHSTVGQSTKNNVEDMASGVDGSSILETASLMKQSVFMSPTFNSTTATASETSCEQNISTIITESEQSIQDELIVVNNVDNTDDADIKKVCESDINPPFNVTLQSEDIEKYPSIKEYEVESNSGDLILTNASYEARNKTDNDTNNLNKMSPVDDHADEAYSSDGSNSYSGVGPEITNNNSETISNQHKPNKIKILSEKIISHSDFNNIQNSHIQSKSSCFLIPVNTIVSGKATTDCFNNLKQKTIQDQVNTIPDVIIKINDESGDFGNSNNMLEVESETNKNSPEGNIESVNKKKKGGVLNNLANDTNKYIPEVNIELENVGLLNNLESEMNKDIPEVNIEIDDECGKLGVLKYIECETNEEVPKVNIDIDDKNKKVSILNNSESKSKNKELPEVNIEIDDECGKLGVLNYLESATNEEVPKVNLDTDDENRKVSILNNLESKTNNKELPEVNIEIDDECGKLGVSNYLESETNEDVSEVNIKIVEGNGEIRVVNNLSTVTNHGLIEQDNIKKENSHNVKSEVCSNRQIVFETDKSILPIIYGTNESLIQLDEDEKLEAKLMNDNTKEIVSNTENSSSKSKICIQGVEKPGGTYKDRIHTVLKTYKRNNKLKQIPKLPHSDFTNIVDTNTLPVDVIINLDDINVGGYKNANKFCICSDFGQLENYDSDVDYQHLHFCNHNNVDCNLETIFRMYDDTFVLPELNITDDIDVVDDDIETTQHDICWLSFICEDNDEAIELAIIESKMNGSNSVSGQLRRSTRKRKSTVTETVTESVEPKPKKTTKCGACGLVLSEAEWDKHKESEHNSIAWKDGQAIVENFSNEKHTKNAPEKIDTTPKLTQPTRRSSRNLGINVSESSIDNNTKFNTNSGHFDAPFKKIQSSSSIELVIPCESKKSATNEQLDTPVSKSKDVKVTPKSMRSIYMPANSIEIKDTLNDKTRDAPKTEVKYVSSKDTEINVFKKADVTDTTHVASKATEIKHTSKEETKGTQRSTRRSNDTTKNSGIKDLPKPDVMGTRKSTKNSIDGASKDSEIKHSFKSEVKDTLKSPKKSIEVASKAVEIKDTPKGEVKNTPKSKRRSIEASSKTTNCTESKDTSKSTKISVDVSSEEVAFKDTLKAEVANNIVTFKSETRSVDVTSIATESKDTVKSTRLSIDVSSKATEVKDSQKTVIKDTQNLSRRSSNVKALSRSNRDVDDEERASLKTIRKSIDVTGSSNLTTKTKSSAEAISKSNDADISFNSKTKKSDSSKKTIKKSDEATLIATQTIEIEVPQKQITKFENNKAITESFEGSKKVETPITPKRKLKEIDIFSSSPKKLANIESQLKSTKKSKDEPANVENTPKSKRSCSKTIGIEVSNKSKNNTDDAASLININKNITDHTHKETTETPVIETKRNYSSPKSITKSQSTSSSKFTRKFKECERISTEVEKGNNKKLQKTMNTSVDASPIQNYVQIDISTQSAKSVAAETTSKMNSQEVTVDDSSSSNNENKVNSEDSSKSQPADKIYCISIKEEVLPKCGVCQQAVDDSDWLEHISKEHDYLAWREDDPPLDLEDDEAIRAHLYAIVKANGPLKCSKCDVTRKYAKSYLTHIRSCNGEVKEQSQMDVSTASTDVDNALDPDDVPLKSYSRGSVRNTPHQPRPIVCGVCSETVMENKWIDHIRIEHKYLAWKSGETPVDVDDETEVKIFLQNISKNNGGLICSKCGVVRFYAKKWMEHEATCKGEGANESGINGENAGLIEIEIIPEIVVCGKCKLEMAGESWMDHIEKEHNYLSWIEGRTPLDENDPEALGAYLHSIVRTRGSLYCAKCGVTRKYPKAYLTHINACEISGFKREDYFVAVSSEVKSDEFECAVCHEKGYLKQWKKHAMEKHYNIAWMAGEMPINLKNPYAVEKYLKEYRMKHNLICKVCGASRASCYGFYAHILTCGKKEKDLEELMNMCDICNNKYLCIYRNQHITMHREQVFKKEKKERDALLAEELKNTPKVEETEPSGKRRAAEKAKKVMEKYTSNIQDGSQCPTCRIEFVNESQLKEHACHGSPVDDGSDSDVSIKLEEHDESDDDMVDVDSSISDEDEDLTKRKRFPESIPKIVLPYKVNDFSYYLAKSFEHFCGLHYTSELLYNNWRSHDYSVLSKEEASVYLPYLSESCKLRINATEWETYTRFEAKKRKEISVFTGATIRCMQWVPHRSDDDRQDNYLSVACFRGSDCPRYETDELPQHPGLLQIWNMATFMSVPKLQMGIAHDFGTIWAMDWCPSGTRDTVPLESEIKSCRLGLVAIACSNGSAYILSVPLIHTEPDDETIIKLKPVAELRFTAHPNRPPYRVTYQATSISWSPQKDHEVIMVGYSDGTTALYNLNTASPLLKTIENGVHIFYPFQDARTENSSVTGVTLNASGDLRRIVGGVASSSVTGATMSGWPAFGPVVRSHLATSSVLYTPNWPAALLCSDDVLTIKSTNEMEWWGGGRRLGGACAAGACARCGRVALTAPPFVRVLRAHPCYPELKKQIVATMKMVPIAQKRKLKLVNDDLGMIVEPLTYEDTMKKYGLEFKPLPKKDQNVASKLSDSAEQCAERFPLSDMPAAAFCPSTEHHHRLAIASHAGFIFIIST